MNNKDMQGIGEYKDWLKSLKSRIQQSQIKAAIQVNGELLRLYWQMGAEIVEKQLETAWGSNFFVTLSKDLKAAFPSMKGFSVTNLKYIKRFYLFYAEYGHQVGDDLTELNFLFQIPWRHHVEIFTRCKDLEEAKFYIQQTVANNWSRAVLDHQIDLRLYDRQGKAVTNFKQRLPDIQSDLAQQLTKDPYIFDFLSMREQHDEKELEDYLVQNMTRFLLELGKGFCFYGKQVHLNVGGDDFYIDLLFYNVQLHCYVVVELKAVKFRPEHIGQLKFYVTAVDRQIRSEHDNATIGLLICKDKNDVVAEYTLSDVNNPIGISSYEVYDKLAEGYKSSLPSIEEIEKQLSDEA